jgi:hypothetical protein
LFSKRRASVRPVAFFAVLTTTWSNAPTAKANAVATPKYIFPVQAPAAHDENRLFFAARRSLASRIIFLSAMVARGPTSGRLVFSSAFGNLRKNA